MFPEYVPARPTSKAIAGQSLNTHRGQSATSGAWTDTSGSSSVIRGAIEYEFEDGAPPLTVGARDAFALSTGRAHRGTNRADEATRLFVIDDPADASL
jgi:hypothetical protein